MEGAVLVAKLNLQNTELKRTQELLGLIETYIDLKAFL